MSLQGQRIDKKQNRGISRREFLKIAGITTIGVGIGDCAVFDKAPSQFIRPEDLDSGVLASKGYLLIDTKKCQGCLSCMLACSLVHEGKESLSLSRIQITQNPFEKYPDDISLGQCRQCLIPACVETCPTGALHIDTENGNIRIVDFTICIGCMGCINACPYEPARVVWNFEEEHALKCDLCMSTPFWKDKGGIGGKQACVTLCPVGAIKFSGRIPVQKGDIGYEVNLRGKNWARLGYPTD